MIKQIKLKMLNQMKKIILLTTVIVLFSCSTEEITADQHLEEITADQNLIEENENLTNDDTANSDKNGQNTNKDSDNDGINDDADVDGEGISDDEYRKLSDTKLSSTVQQKITAYINENHSGKTITEVEIENQIIEVELNGNIELSFNLSGDFLGTKVDDEDYNDNENEYRSLSGSSLSEVVQQKIKAYINAHYPNDTIAEVEIENQKIEVELYSDIELIFDLNGNFVRLDD